MYALQPTYVATPTGEFYKQSLDGEELGRIEELWLVSEMNKAILKDPIDGSLYFQ